jgi:hypothetical protein
MSFEGSFRAAALTLSYSLEHLANVASIPRCYVNGRVWMVGTPSAGPSPIAKHLNGLTPDLQSLNVLQPSVSISTLCNSCSTTFW